MVVVKCNQELKLSTCFILQVLQKLLSRLTLLKFRGFEVCVVRRCFRFCYGRYFQFLKVLVRFAPKLKSVLRQVKVAES